MFIDDDHEHPDPTLEHLILHPDDPELVDHDPPPLVLVHLPNRTRPRPVSGRDEPVDHERQPGVPPPHAIDDFTDILDIEGAETFPASDPPSGW
ncbi:MAG: hypothetical protein KDC46_06020 [Thermoleophilia bacterium]|nr:hypothetical protein [Thermoleophilia bacterium]